MKEKNTDDKPTYDTNFKIQEYIDKQKKRIKQ